MTGKLQSNRYENYILLLAAAQQIDSTSFVYAPAGNEET